jgi:hypothetical protein
MNLRQNIEPARFLELFRKARLSVFEMVFLLAAFLFAAFVAYFYLTRVQPLNSEVARLKNRESELRVNLKRLNNDEKKRAEQAANSEKILESLNRFENYLKPDQRGMTQIINEIDSLGKAHKILVGDASYRVAEPQEGADENGNPKPQTAGNDKKSNIYPALGVDTTVIGDYRNLRRFISDLERSKQFLIINSLTFQGEADKARQNPGKAQQIQLSSPESIPVSLKIELDTYFQKASR